MIITRCKANHISNPLGFDLTPLRLSWTVEDSVSTKQSAARVEISLKDDFSCLIHDSGLDTEIDSICYTTGVKLSARTRYYWRVTVIGDRGDTAESPVSWFETGKMGEAFTGDMISPDFGDKEIHPYIRRRFSASEKVRSARMYATGLGLYELYINGVRVGEEYLTPGCNAYDKWLQIQVYDVTAFILEGENCIGAMLGNGWAKGRFGVRSNYNNYCDEFALLCELRISYENGTESVIATDELWLCAPSPVLTSGIYDGEYYDANKEIYAWADAGFDDGNWRHCIKAKIEHGKLTDRLSPQVRIMEELHPVDIIHTPVGETVLDMGQNMVGFLRFRVNVPKGTELCMSFGEILQNSCFYRDNLRSAEQKFLYISNGTGSEAQPHFTFFGFRYVKLEGFPSNIALSDFTGCVLYSEMERTGFVETSDDNVNRLFDNVIWGQKGNFVDTPTDCPQRDERLGWSGDAQIFCETSALNMDVFAFFTKYLYDLFEEQKSLGGRVPHVAPDVYPKKSVYSGLGGAAAGWADAAVVIPWVLYKQYGDRAILQRQFDSMKAWVDWVREQDKECGDSGLWSGINSQQIGDWLSLDAADSVSRFGGTDMQYLCCAYYRYSAMLVAKAAAVLGKFDLSREYEELSERVRKAIQNEYFTPSGRCAIRTQTALVMALHMELVQDEFRQKTLDDLKRLILQDRFSIKTGFLGTPLLCRTLSEEGEHDYACCLFFNRDAPGWLYQVDMGATTIWERWNSVLSDGTMSEDGMNSLNHYAYGAIVFWIYSYLCGIRSDEDFPGYRHYTLKPMPCDQLSHARAEFLSPIGRITCAWQREDNGEIIVNAEVPFGAEAKLILHDNAETILLKAGIYTFRYFPARPTSYLERPLGELLTDKETMAIIREISPILHECPGDMLHLTIGDIRAGRRMELFAPDENLRHLIAALEQMEK